MATADTREFTFEPDRTCKIRWTFRLGGDPADPVVEEVRIVGRRKDPSSTREHGCLGHPRTIEALLRGRRVSSVPLEELEAQDCPRPRSCGQCLAECLRNIREKKCP